MRFEKQFNSIRWFLIDISLASPNFSVPHVVKSVDEFFFALLFNF